MRVRRLKGFIAFTMMAARSQVFGIELRVAAGAATRLCG
jgi:hypothetical protein